MQSTEPSPPADYEVHETDAEIVADEIASVLGAELDWDWEAVPHEHIPSSRRVLLDIAGTLMSRFEVRLRSASGSAE